MKDQIDAMIFIFSWCVGLSIISGISIWLGVYANTYPLKTFFTLLAVSIIIIIWAVEK